MTVSKSNFLRDVNTHKLNVLNDSGVNRHLRIRAVNTHFMWYEIVTWSDSLCFNGDVGSYTFSRVYDMFSFFGEDLDKINYYYWAQKLQAQCIYSPAKAFSFDKFKKEVENYYHEFINNNLLSESEAQELRHSLEEEIFADVENHSDSDYQKYAAYENISAYNGPILFEDFWDYDTDDYNDSFKWACHAIVHAIKEYNSLTKTEKSVKVV